MYNLIYIVYVNNASQPIAAFAWREQAETWAESNYPGAWRIEALAEEA